MASNSYIDLINLFWKTSQSVEFSSNEVYLYFFLLNECNSRGWENPFECPNRRIVLSTGISEPTVIDCRNRLQQKGLIQFENGKRNAKSPVYYLNNLSKNFSKTFSKPLSKTFSKKANINNKTKDIKTKDISPIPPAGVDDKPKWKDNFEVYLDGLRSEYRKVLADRVWMEQQMKFNPGVDIGKSIEKACVNYWATEAGWKKKKRSQITDIDWRSTFANAVSQRTNRVYKDSLFNSQKTDKYEQKRIDSEQRKLDSLTELARISAGGEWERKRKELEATCGIGEVPNPDGV